MDGVQNAVDGVSSYQLLTTCNVSEKYDDYDLEGVSSGNIHGQNISYVGNNWNDGVILSFAFWANP